MFVGIQVYYYVPGCTILYYTWKLCFLCYVNYVKCGNKTMHAEAEMAYIIFRYNPIYVQPSIKNIKRKFMSYLFDHK